LSLLPEHTSRFLTKQQISDLFHCNSHYIFFWDKFCLFGGPQAFVRKGWLKPCYTNKPRMISTTSIHSHLQLACQALFKALPIFVEIPSILAHQDRVFFEEVKYLLHASRRHPRCCAVVLPLPIITTFRRFVAICNDVQETLRSSFQGTSNPRAWVVLV